jgi:hypothetical protein
MNLTKEQHDILLERIKEEINLYFCGIVMKNDTTYNKIDIINRLRAIEGIVVIKVRQSDYLRNRGTEQVEYTLLETKLISGKDNPDNTLAKIKNLATTGDSKIPGLLQFYPLKKTLKKL